jgi:hypothetical protein
MLTCPQCKKTWPEPHRQCPTCQADLSLLADFLTAVQTGLERAEASARAGNIGQAMSAYLAVLEVDPENALARQRVAGIAEAVRQFDRANLPPQAEPPAPPRQPEAVPAQVPPPPAPPVSQPVIPPPPTVPPNLVPAWAWILGGAVLFVVGLAAGYVASVSRP